MGPSGCHPGASNGYSQSETVFPRGRPAAGSKRSTSRRVAWSAKMVYAGGTHRRRTDKVRKRLWHAPIDTIIMENLGKTHANLDQQAYGAIRKLIIGRKLLPGEKIPQEKLAQDLGVSRTPVVNALKYLEKEKLVASRPRRGFFVRLFTKEEMISIFELREVLEGLAARRASAVITDHQKRKLQGFFRQFSDQKVIRDFKTYSREDRRFHNYITTVGAKEFLKSILESYNIITFSYQQLTSEGLIRDPNDTIREHHTICAAICDNDGEAAEKLMRQHFKRSISALEQSH
jgi:DNA-binding GntR family transcriptional regulator